MKILKKVKIRNTTPRGKNAPRRLTERVAWPSAEKGTHSFGSPRPGKSGRRKIIAARHQSRLALFLVDYHKHHGKLPPELPKAEMIKFRNRELARFAKEREAP